MGDILYIKELQVMARIGVHNWEQHIEQPLLLDIEIPINTQSIEDSLERTIDYSALCQLVSEFVSSHPFFLIETVANKVASLLKTHYTLSEVTVTVMKPQAIPNARYVAIKITR